LSNNEVDDREQKEAYLLPKFCTNYESSSSSNSSGESSEDDDSIDIDFDDSSKSFMSDQGLSKMSHSGDGVCQINLSSSHHFNDLSVSMSKSLKKKNKKMNKKKKRKTKWSTYWSRYECFARSPRVHFFYDAFFYLIFLMMFNYMILCEFNYYDDHNENSNHDYLRKESYMFNSMLPNNNSNETLTKNSRNFYSNISLVDVYNISTYDDYNIFPHKNSSTNNKNHGNNPKINQPSKIEILLIYWMFGFIAEELRQVYFNLIIFLTNAFLRIMKYKFSLSSFSLEMLRLKFKRASKNI
jgi:hypothetical protein